MRRKLPSAKALRLPLIDLSLAASGISRSAEWLDRVAVERALGVGRYWGEKIVKLLATRTTEYGALVKRERLADLVQREITRRARERTLRPEDILAKQKSIETARQRYREKIEAAHERGRQRKQRTLNRIRVAVQLRAQGWTWARIGKRLGVSRQRARQMGDEYVRRGRL